MIEEAHLVLCSGDFRKCFGDLHTLNAFAVPKLIITATLPPSTEQDLMKALGFSDAAIHRDQTNRVNIRYIVSRQVITSATLPTMITEAVASAKAKLSPRGQILVFCVSQAWADKTGETLGCMVHHSEIVDRDEILEKFQNGDDQVLACTSTLSAGVDFDRVEWVIHLGSPYTMIEFVQESGRAGRRGQRSGSIIFPGSRPTRHHGFESWLRQHSSCRRLWLSQYMDGRAETCASLGASRCDVCEPDQTSQVIASPPRSGFGPTRSVAAPSRPAAFTIPTAPGITPPPRSGFGPTRPVPAPSRGTPYSVPEPRKTFQTKAERLAAQASLESRGERSPVPTAIPDTQAYFQSAAQRAAMRAAGVPEAGPSTQRSAVAVDADRQRGQERADAILYDELHQMLERHQPLCGLCLGKGRVVEHLTKNCPDRTYQWFEKSSQPFRKAVQLQGGHGMCFTCYLPKPKNDGLQRWHISEGEHGHVFHKDVVRESLVSLWECASLRDECLQAMHCEARSIDKWARWMAEPSPKSRPQRPMVVMHWLLKRAIA